MPACPSAAWACRGTGRSPEPTETELRTTIERFASLGLQVQVTELDVSVYPWEKDRRAKRPGESDAYTPAMQQQQAAQYQLFFKVFRDEAQAKRLTGVTFWNVSDHHTWLDEYPVAGRKNHPLLFDETTSPSKPTRQWSSFR